MGKFTMLRFSTNQESIRDTAAQVAGQLQPLIEESLARRKFPWDAVRKIQGAGLLRLLVPRESGGQAADFVALCLAQEEVAKVDVGLSNFISDQAVPSNIMRVHGTREQMARFFSTIVDKSGLWCLAVTEPEAGSDLASIRTRAERRGDSYIINGQKSWASTGGVADLYVILATTDPGQRIGGLTAFVVERTSPGFRIGREHPKMGWWTMSTTELALEDVEVASENRIGEEGAGYEVFLTALIPGRLGIAAQSVGLASAAYQYARDYASTRVQFGRPVATFQAIRFMLADMATAIESARLLTYHAAQSADEGSHESEKLSAMAKYFTSDMAMQITVDAVQILGAAGYTTDHPVEKMMRDAKALQIADGTNQIMRVIVARAILN